MESSGRALNLSGVTKKFPSSAGEVAILEDVDLSVEAGQTVAIVGPSGSGKSTLLNLIGALDRPTSGTIRLGNVDVAGLKGEALAEYRACRVGFIFQDHHLLPQLTAAENVLIPALAAWRAAEADGRAGELLERMGVAQRAEAFPAQMSGGERQRVAVARALINRPGLLLCDEPTGNLDAENARGVVDLFLEIAKRDGVTVLMVTHNLEQARRFGRRSELKAGKLAGRLGRSAP
jgi:ABC-type lipoprotein export system ATPase subunit